MARKTKRQLAAEFKHQMQCDVERGDWLALAASILDCYQWDAEGSLARKAVDSFIEGLNTEQALKLEEAMRFMR